MKRSTSFKISKTTMLIPLFALSMHSCRDTRETGIVKGKIDNQVFLTPVNDTDYVYRLINFNNVNRDRQTENIYLNMNKGDTVLFYNFDGDVEVEASCYSSAVIGSTSRYYYNVVSINGVHRDSLPDLVRKQKHDAEIKALNEKYNNLRRQH